MGKKLIKKTNPKQNRDSVFVELEGEDLKKFKNIMEKVGKNLIVAKRQSKRMAHDARKATANAILNY